MRCWKIVKKVLLFSTFVELNCRRTFGQLLLRLSIDGHAQPIVCPFHLLLWLWDSYDLRHLLLLQHCSSGGEAWEGSQRAGQKNECWQFKIKRGNLCSFLSNLSLLLFGILNSLHNYLKDISNISFGNWKHFLLRQNLLSIIWILHV